MYKQSFINRNDEYNIVKLYKDVIEFLCDYLKISYTVIKSEFKDKYRIVLYGEKLVAEMKRLGVKERRFLYKDLIYTNIRRNIYHI